jgi:hypothetical protein
MEKKVYHFLQECSEAKVVKNINSKVKYRYPKKLLKYFDVSTLHHCISGSVYAVCSYDFSFFLERYIKAPAY